MDRADSGTLVFSGEKIDLTTNYNASKAIKSGISMVSENRKEEGLAVDLPILNNISLSSLKRFKKNGPLRTLDLEKEKMIVIEQGQKVSLKYADIMDPCTSLSGGNQQKVALARILTDGSDILLLDEPTRGIDVRSKVEIYALIGKLAAQGKGIVMVSSYLPELFGICDSLAVMHRGSLSPVKPVREWTEESVMSWATTGK